MFQGGLVWFQEALAKSQEVTSNCGISIAGCSLLYLGTTFHIILQNSLMQKLNQLSVFEFHALIDSYIS